MTYSHSSTHKKVIAGVIERNGKFLIAQRSKKDSFYGKWEFPGGKMEAGETEEGCLQRELFEELGIRAEIGSYICSSYFEQNGTLFELKAWYIHSFSGEPILFEHQQIKWVEKSELLQFEYPEPDLPIIQELLKS